MGQEQEIPDVKIGPTLTGLRELKKLTEILRVTEARQLQSGKWYFFTPKMLLGPHLIGFHKINSVSDKAFSVSTVRPSNYSFEVFATIVGPFEITEQPPSPKAEAKTEVPPHTDAFHCGVDKDDHIFARVDITSDTIDFIAEGDEERVTIQLAPMQAVAFSEQVLQLAKGIKQ